MACQRNCGDCYACFRARAEAAEKALADEKVRVTATSDTARHRVAVEDALRKVAEDARRHAFMHPQDVPQVLKDSLAALEALGKW